MGRKKGITKELIYWRRIEVARLLSRGVSVKVIAERLHLDARTIFEDQRYIREHASEVLDKYLVETLPAELAKCLSRLNQVSDESWTLVDDKKVHARDKLAALARAESSAINIIKLLTNNRELVYAALGKKSLLSGIRESTSPSTESLQENEEEEEEREGARYHSDNSDESDEEYEEEPRGHELHSKDSCKNQSENNSNQRIF